MLAGSACQIVTMTGFLLTQDPLNAMSMTSRARFGTNQFVIVTYRTCGFGSSFSLPEKRFPQRSLSDLVPSDSCT